MSSIPPELDPLVTSLKRVKALQPSFPMDTVLLNRLIHFAHRQLEQQTSELLASEGLLISHWMVLAMLYGGNEFRRRPQELSAAIGQSGPNTTKTTTFLMDKGWVLRIADSDNKRSCWMQLSPQGKDVVEALLPRVWTRYEHSLSALSEQEQGMLSALLIKLFAGKPLACSKN